jgi:hypothetical protein
VDFKLDTSFRGKECLRGVEWGNGPRQCAPNTVKLEDLPILSGFARLPNCKPCIVHPYHGKPRGEERATHSSRNQGFCKKRDRACHGVGDIFLVAMRPRLTKQVLVVVCMYHLDRV